MKNIKSFFIALFFVLLLSSCYSYTAVVGEGAKSDVVTKEWNHYVLWGLVPINPNDPRTLAGDAENYEINVKHTFLNMLVGGLTGGIYSPTMTTVTK